jgi:hypothetical protein
MLPPCLTIRNHFVYGTTRRTLETSEKKTWSPICNNGQHEALSVPEILALIQQNGRGTDAEEMLLFLVISVIKPTRGTIFEFVEHHCTCFGRSFRLSSGVQDCTHSIMYISYRFVDCPLASSQLTCMTYLMLYVQS